MTRSYQLTFIVIVSFSCFSFSNSEPNNTQQILAALKNMQQPAGIVAELRFSPQTLELSNRAIALGEKALMLFPRAIAGIICISYALSIARNTCNNNEKNYGKNITTAGTFMLIGIGLLSKFSFGIF